MGYQILQPIFTGTGLDSVDTAQTKKQVLMGRIFLFRQTPDKSVSNKQPQPLISTMMKTKCDNVLSDRDRSISLKTEIIRKPSLQR